MILGDMFWEQPILIPTPHMFVFSTQMYLWLGSWMTDLEQEPF